MILPQQQVSRHTCFSKKNSNFLANFADRPRICANLQQEWHKSRDDLQNSPKSGVFFPSFLFFLGCGPSVRPSVHPSVRPTEKFPSVRKFFYHLIGAGAPRSVRSRAPAPIKCYPAADRPTVRNFFFRPSTGRSVRPSGNFPCEFFPQNLLVMYLACPLPYH